MKTHIHLQLCKIATLNRGILFNTTYLWDFNESIHLIDKEYNRWFLRYVYEKDFLINYFDDNSLYGYGIKLEFHNHNYFKWKWIEIE